MDYTKPERQEKPSKNTEDKKLDKVVVGEVITKKKPIGTRVRETLFGEELSVVSRYLASEVLLPAFRNLVVDSVSKGVARLVYGDNAPRTGRTEYSPHVSFGRSQSYTNYNRKTNTRPVTTGFRGSRSNHQVDDVIVGTRRDAFNVLEKMQDIIDAYDVVSVSDFKELTGYKPTPVDNEWGWTYLNDADVREVREGYLIRLPNPDHI